jgi:hypothetical protein
MPTVTLARTTTVKTTAKVTANAMLEPPDPAPKATTGITTPAATRPKTHVRAMTVHAPVGTRGSNGRDVTTPSSSIRSDHVEPRQ